MKVVVSTFAHSHAEALVQMIESCASQQHEVIYYLHLHSRYPDVVATCECLAQRPDVLYFPHGVNRGLANSFNDTLVIAYTAGAQMVINSNDDSLWSEGDLDRLIACTASQPQQYAVTCLGSHAGRPIEDMGYCAVAFNPIAWERLGCFDQNFFPAYFEDTDYGRRAEVAGFPKVVCEGTFVQHKGGTIYKNEALREQNHKTFVRNRDYYLAKWGGLPGQETLLNPFGQFSLYIAPEERNAPYPSFNRTDQEIVVL